MTGSTRLRNPCLSTVIRSLMLNGRFLTVGLLLLLASACGGGGSEQLRLDEWAQKYNALCLETISDLKATGIADVETPAELEQSLERAVPIIRKANDEIRALGLPDEEQQGVQRLVDLNKRSQQLLEQVLDALQADDLERARQSFATFDGVNTEISAIEHDIGAEECSQGGKDSSEPQQV